MRWRVLLMFFLSLQHAFSGFAMDSSSTSSSSDEIIDLDEMPEQSFSVSDAKQLLQQNWHEDVPHFDGWCNQSNMNSVVSMIYCIAIPLGTTLLIAAAVCTGVAFPTTYPPREFRPELFLAGMILWGLFGASVIGPPIVIVSINNMRNALGNANNKKLAPQLDKLKGIWAEQTRLVEDQISALGPMIFDAHTDILKKLDAGQALTLALVDFSKFKSIVLSSQTGSPIFSTNANIYAIRLIQILDEPDATRAETLARDEVHRWFLKEPAFYWVLNHYLPPNTIAHFELPIVYQGTFNRDDGTSYTPIEEGEPLLALAPIEPEDHEENLFELKVQARSFRVNKEKLVQISQSFAEMFDNIGDSEQALDLVQSASFRADLSTVIQIEELSKITPTLINLANMDGHNRRTLVIDKRNVEQMLKIARQFAIEFLKEKCDAHCYKYGLPGAGEYEKIHFACSYEIPQCKKLMSQGLLAKLNELEFGIDELRAIKLLGKKERADIISSIRWDNLYARFNSDHKHLRAVWDRVQKEKNLHDVKTKLIDYCHKPEHASTVQWAFPILPKKIKVPSSS